MNKMKVNRVIRGDCLEEMKDLPTNCVDLLLTDPPYGSDLEWDGKNAVFHRLWLREAKRLLKRGGSFYCFFAPLNMYAIEGLIRKLFSLKNVIVWHHPNLYGAGMSYGDDRYKSTWDVVFYAVNGENAKHGKNVAAEAYQRFQNGFDVVVEPQPRPLQHKAQKPLSLMRRFIQLSSVKGDLVMDPFGGAGTTAVAAKQLQRDWILIEKEQKYVEIARKRIQKVHERTLQDFVT